MTIAVALACGCTLFLPRGIPAQDPFAPEQERVATADGRDPDGNKNVIMALAEAYQDSRPIEQIKKDNALIRAAAQGDVAAVRAALRSGALVNSRYIDGYAFLSEGASGYTALMRASSAGHAEVVKMLIDAKADGDLERRGRTSLYMAVRTGRDEVVKLLVAAGAKGDPRQMRLTHDLLCAACRGFRNRAGEGFPLYPGSVGDPDTAPEIVDVLKRGADVNVADPQGYTALMYAANLGLVENVKVLLASGADAGRKSRHGETALSLAVRPESSVAQAERRQVAELLKAHLAMKK